MAPSPVRSVDRFPLPLRLGQPEVEHLDDVLLPLAGQDQVLRLDVAVDQLLLVGVLQPIAAWET